MLKREFPIIYTPDKIRIRRIMGNICDISRGVIMQQVNCRNAYGRGISGAISTKWPVVLADYRTSFMQKSACDLFKTVRYIEINPDLIIANSYTQFDYGNSERTGKVYTDMPALINAITKTAQEYNDVHIPFRIGCGLAGGNWNELYNAIKHLPITIVQLQ